MSLITRQATGIEKPRAILVIPEGRENVPTFLSVASTGISLRSVNLWVECLFCRECFLVPNYERGTYVVTWCVKVVIKRKRGVSALASIALNTFEHQSSNNEAVFVLVNLVA